MDLKKLNSDLEEVILRHIPETSRSYDMTAGLQMVLEDMVVMHEGDSLDWMLSALETLFSKKDKLT